MDEEEIKIIASRLKYNKKFFCYNFITIFNNKWNKSKCANFLKITYFMQNYRVSVINFLIKKRSVINFILT